MIAAPANGTINHKAQLSMHGASLQLLADQNLTTQSTIAHIQVRDRTDEFVSIKMKRIKGCEFGKQGGIEPVKSLYGERVWKSSTGFLRLGSKLGFHKSKMRNPRNGARRERRRELGIEDDGAVAMEGNDH
ncbi:hypothetical protein U1Q18_006513 [Sarracenia purpurea var. burkii]